MEKGQRWLAYHFIDRVFCSIEEKRNGVLLEDVINALQHPKEIREPNVNKNSQLFLNDNVGVSINPITGKLIQTNPI